MDRAAWTEADFADVFNRHLKERRTVLRGLLLQVCDEAQRSVRQARDEALEEAARAAYRNGPLLDADGNEVEPDRSTHPDAHIEWESAQRIRALKSSPTPPISPE